MGPADRFNEAAEESVVCAGPNPEADVVNRPGWPGSIDIPCISALDVCGGGPRPEPIRDRGPTDRLVGILGCELLLLL